MIRKIKNWFYLKSFKNLQKHISNSERRLTPDHLLKLGWVKDESNSCYYDPDIKERDKISVQFQDHYYRVFHGGNLNFIALEDSLEWFEMYYFLINSQPLNIEI